MPNSMPNLEPTEDLFTLIPGERQSEERISQIKKALEEKFGNQFRVNDVFGVKVSTLLKGKDVFKWNENEQSFVLSK